MKKADFIYKVVDSAQSHVRCDGEFDRTDFIEELEKLLEEFEKASRPRISIHELNTTRLRDRTIRISEL